MRLSVVRTVFVLNLLTACLVIALIMHYKHTLRESDRSAIRVSWMTDGIAKNVHARIPSNQQIHPFIGLLNTSAETKKRLESFQKVFNNKERISKRDVPNVGSDSGKSAVDVRWITDCITKNVLGKIPANLQTQPFTDLGKTSNETAKQRLESFQKVFKNKEWINEGDDPNVVSGAGSTLVYSQEAMAGLHTIISDLKSQLGLSRIRMLDIPCGDMTWMSRFLKTRNDIDYTGYDIVPELIIRHTDAFKNRPWKFFQHDIVEKPLNHSFDLIFSRMMLQHLRTQDAIKILSRFSNSGSRFLLTTTFPRVKNNGDLDSNSKGRFRLLNLEIPPFALLPPMCIFRDGEEGTSGGDSHALALWRLPLQRVTGCSDSIAIKIVGKDVSVHSCTNWTLVPN